MSKLEHLPSHETNRSDSIERVVRGEPVLDKLDPVSGETMQGLGFVACDGSPCRLCKHHRKDTGTYVSDDEADRKMTDIQTVERNDPETYRDQFIYPTYVASQYDSTSESVFVSFGGIDLGGVSFEIPRHLFWRLQERNSEGEINYAYTRIEAIRELMDYLYIFEKRLKDEKCVLDDLERNIDSLYQKIIIEEFKLHDLNEQRLAKVGGALWHIDSPIVG